MGLPFTNMERSYDPLNDRISYLTLVDHMGSDLLVVNDARVSYDNNSSEWRDEEDGKLLKYLMTAKPMHKSPLYGCVLKFKVCCPLFVRNQWWKHHVASNYTSEQDGWNEQSLRYSKSNCEVYMPNVLHKPSKHNRQKGGEEFEASENTHLKSIIDESVTHAIKTYNYLVMYGVSREEARMVLPANVYTTFIWTVSLMSVLNFISLRDHASAQYEIAQYANCVSHIVEDLFPNVHKHWSLQSGG